MCITVFLKCVRYMDQKNIQAWFKWLAYLHSIKYNVNFEGWGGGDDALSFN